MASTEKGEKFPNNGTLARKKGKIKLWHIGIHHVISKSTRLQTTELNCERKNEDDV